MIKKCKRRSVEQYLSLEIDSTIYKQYNKICFLQKKKDCSGAEKLSSSFWKGSYINIFYYIPI